MEPETSLHDDVLVAGTSDMPGLLPNEPVMLGGNVLFCFACGI